MEHLSDNELIAVFMGFSCCDTGQDRFWNPPSQPQATVNDWEYHTNHLDDFRTSWDWLMPVVEKISQIRCAPDSEVDHDCFYLRTFGMLNATTNKPMVRLNRCPVFEADTLIEATYLAVVDFIKSYNK